MGFWSAINPFDGDVIEGVNVRNAIKQVLTGQDQDVFDSITNSNRPGQVQIDGNYDIGAPGNIGYVPTGGGTALTGGGTALTGGIGTALTGGRAPSGTPAMPAINQAAVNNTQIALDQLPGLLASAMEGENTRYGNTTRGFDAQRTGQQKTYDDSTVTNQQNYDSNYMESIRSGIKGLVGLFNILRGTGAAGGTAQEMARDTVGGVTTNDIRMGFDTQKTNQTSLDSVLSNFLTELKGKRQVNEDTFENNKRSIGRDNATQMQDLLGKMAGYYGDAGRTDEAVSYMNRAGSLTPQIAANSNARQSAYDTTPVAVQAPQVTAFAKPTQPDVTVATPNEVGAGIFTMDRKKKEQQVPQLVSAGV